ncbi:hypothetical protein IWQ56_001288 [Coemansia nantahalensis]|uniref:Uncharacterized protein n=1 Tax=Coemansia nantahalensis TaxID=2789366 RepID=A0ACC1K325_9FUNG|nr:hypothetical protein IWQ56_001288 [Coemansia nantahalensis]KAJ2772657.1 hypothetical protein IWQ57_001674 [Coemansia nantahalensis]
MAHFYITSPDEMAGRAPAHPDEALDMSVRKLQDIKETQRATHRQANLLKTVLVYNMFRRATGAPAAPPPARPQHNAARCTPAAAAAGVVPVSPADSGELRPAAAATAMDVCPDACPDACLDSDPDEGADEGGPAAEQSWFDHCLDRMLIEDDQSMGCQPPPVLSSSDDEGDEDNGRDGGGSSDGGCALRRCQQAAAQSLCTLGGAAAGIGGQHLAIPAQAVSECDLWVPEFSFDRRAEMELWDCANLLAAGMLAPGALEACIE